jgi:HD domain
MKQLTQALAFIAEQHQDTGTDQTGRPYITHPIQVLNHLVQADITDESVLIAGLLHDIRLYTGTTQAQITSLFGPRVGELVAELYYDRFIGGTELQISLLDRQVDLSDEAQQIVLADLIANTRDDYYDSYGSDLTQRARGAFSRLMFNETPEPHPKLAEQFREAMAEFCDRNDFDPDESYWGFIDEDTRRACFEQLERAVAELQAEFGEVADVTE